MKIRSSRKVSLKGKVSDTGIMWIIIAIGDKIVVYIKIIFSGTDHEILLSSGKIFFKFEFLIKDCNT